MCQATRPFWLLLLLDSLFCKETEESISSNGEQIKQFKVDVDGDDDDDRCYNRRRSLAPWTTLSYRPNILTSITVQNMNMESSCITSLNKQWSQEIQQAA